jgi:hypothetical protein
LAALPATLPPMAPATIWMMRLMSSPDMTRHSPDPVLSCSVAPDDSPRRRKA